MAKHGGEDHPLGNLVFHSRRCRLMAASLRTLWHCLPRPAEPAARGQAQAGRRQLLRMLAVLERGSPSLLAWPWPVLFPSITVLAQATYSKGPYAGPSLHPEGSVLSEGPVWTRTPSPHRSPVPGWQWGPSCQFICPPAALSSCLGCAPLGAGVQGAHQPRPLPGSPLGPMPPAHQGGSWL